MHWATLDDTDLSKIEHLDFHEDVQCESVNEITCLPRPPHSADWWIKYSVCGHVMAWCNRRLTFYIQHRLIVNLVHFQCGSEKNEILYWIPVHAG